MYRKKLVCWEPNISCPITNEDSRYFITVSQCGLAAIDRYIT